MKFIASARSSAEHHVSIAAATWCEALKHITEVVATAAQDFRDRKCFKQATATLSPGDLPLPNNLVAAL